MCTHIYCQINSINFTSVVVDKCNVGHIYRSVSVIIYSHSIDSSDIIFEVRHCREGYSYFTLVENLRVFACWKEVAFQNFVESLTVLRKNITWIWRVKLRVFTQSMVTLHSPYFIFSVAPNFTTDTQFSPITITVAIFALTLIHFNTDIHAFIIIIIIKIPIKGCLL